MLKPQTPPQILPVTQSFYYDPTNVASPRTQFVAGQTTVPSTACWLNLSLTDPQLASFLTKDLALTKNIVDSLIDPRLKSRMWTKQNAIFFSLCGFAMQPLVVAPPKTAAMLTVALNSLPKMVPLNLYLTEKMLITVSSTPSFDFDKLFSVLQIDSVATPQNIACSIMTHMLYQIEDAIASMQQSLIDLEVHVGTLSVSSLIHEIWEIRKQIIDHLHRFHIQEDMLSQVFYEKPAILSDADYVYFKNVVTNLDHCTTAISITERLAIALQAKIDSLANAAMSRKLYLLSIVALFVVPFTVISGVLGMNVHIPGQSQPHAFEYILAGSFSLSIILFIVFRLKKWL